MSENIPTTGKDARAEAERLYRKDATEIEASLSIHDAVTDGFVVGAAWQRSQSVKVTDEMVERGAEAIDPAAFTDGWSLPDWQERAKEQARRQSRAALRAALEGETE